MSRIPLLASLSLPAAHRQLHPLRRKRFAAASMAVHVLLWRPCERARCPAVQNWGASLPPARPGRLLVPRTPWEVADAVVAAAAAERRVRAVGKGHTWTPMFFDGDGVLLTEPSHWSRADQILLEAVGCTAVLMASGCAALDQLAQGLKRTAVLCLRSKGTQHAAGHRCHLHHPAAPTERPAH